MPNFNLRRARNPRPIDRLRLLCPDIRHSDLELNDKDIQRLCDALEQPTVRNAVHGRGDNWTEVDTGYSPYNTSPLVNAVPQFGGRWRGNFPGGGDQHISDDSDKEKSTKGQGNDFDPVLKNKLINDKSDQARREMGDGQYVVRITLGPEDAATPEMAKEMLGEDAKSDGNSIIMLVDDFDKALVIEREQRSKGKKVSIEKAN